MKDVREILEELLGDNILTEATRYTLNRKNCWFDIQIYHFVNGPTAGSYEAVPQALWKRALDQYVGRGRTDQEALRSCLAKIKDIPYESLFPDLPGPEEAS